VDSFICDLARALGRGMAANLRASADAANLGRGELLAIASVLEITGAGPTPDSATALPDETWARMEALARRDLDLVRNARSKAP
jgi:hypothetical protein